MPYADFAFYQERYFGDVLTEDNAARWLSRAGDELDALTFGRLASAFPTNEAHALFCQGEKRCNVKIFIRTYSL